MGEVVDGSKGVRETSRQSARGHEGVQAEAIEALAAAFAQEGGCERIDTHMSHLFLGKVRVYKLIRAVDHVYADLASLKSRRSACLAELEANRALAPGIYVAARPMVRQVDGTVRIGGEGEVVDWIVEMRRFPDGALFSELADGGALTQRLVDEVAETVARFHGGLPPRRDPAEAADYPSIIDRLERTVSGSVVASEMTAFCRPLFQVLSANFERFASLIEDRRRAGFVRRGHGDLHLSNICLYEGRATPFDALAFDPTMATTDVLFDMAFFLMDLRASGLRVFANAAMNRYFDAARQPEGGLALLPGFTALRSAVRMAVAAERGSLDAAACYGRLGLALLKPSAPRLVAVGGLSGSGKSVVARLLAPALDGPCGARLLGADRIRKAGLVETQALDAAAYGPQARTAVYLSLQRKAGEAMDAGASVIADATFRDDETRRGIASVAVGCPFRGFWLEVPNEVRVARVERRGGDVSDATAAVALAQVGPGRLGPAWRILDAAPPAEAVGALALEDLDCPPVETASSCRS